MQDPNSINSLETERCVLACFFRDPAWMGELIRSKSELFRYEPHRVIYNAMYSVYNEKKNLDEPLVKQRIRAVGAQMVDGIDILDYISSIVLMQQYNLKNKEVYVNELIKYYVLRQMDSRLAQQRKYIRANQDKLAHEILPEIEKINAEMMAVPALLDIEEEDGVDLYAEAENYLKRNVERGGVPRLPSPFPTFNRWVGGFRTGQMYVIEAGYKVGKTTLQDACVRHVIENAGAKVCFLNTEMDEDEMMSRYLSSHTGIPEAYFTEAEYIKYPEMVEKTNKALKAYKQFSGKIKHYKVGDKTIDDVISIVKRWHSKYMKEGDIGMVVYDYIKITAETSKNEQEYQIIGRKANSLKNLSSMLPNIVVLTSVQTNRQGQTSQSDRINWVMSQSLHLISKTPKEIGEEHGKFGTHKLLIKAGRFRGLDSSDFVPVKIGEGKNADWVQNHINVEMSNFNFYEIGTLLDYQKTLPKEGKLTPLKQNESNDGGCF